MPAGDILSRLNKTRPRLLISNDVLARVKDNIQKHTLAKKWYEVLRDKAERMLKAPPSQYNIPDGLRLLGTSRQVLERTYTLALLYLLDGDKRYVERVWAELEAAGKFPDWNPRHFLDTAEMTHAFAIGYDWLYNVWRPDQRAAIRSSMVEKGLLPAQESYRHKVKYGWWVGSHHNWNQVCNGGVAMGALAIADEVPELANEILQCGLQSIKLAMAEFAPDGGWGEGPGYWNYATSYNVVYLAGLESVLGTDFGLSQCPGFAETGLFPLYITGNTDMAFNFADAREFTIRAPQMFWLARKFDRPVYSWYQQAHAAPHPLDLIWFAPRTTSPQEANLPPDKYYRHVEVVTLRSSWEDKNGVFIGLKAGDNKMNHSNLDLGTFVLETHGQRWAIDLGPDNYNLPGYFGGKRWTYYRLRAEGHNTLVINPSQEPDQNPRAATRIVRFESRPNLSFAIADLTPAYAKHASRVMRGVKLFDRKTVLVQDEVAAPHPADLWWFMHTRAQINLGEDDSEARLSQHGATLVAKILSPQGVKFTIMKAEPLPTSPCPEGQHKNDNVRKLAIHIEKISNVTIAVFFAPSEKTENPPLTHMEAW